MDLEEFCDMVAKWMDIDDQERDRYGKRPINYERKYQGDNHGYNHDSSNRNGGNPWKRRLDTTVATVQSIRDTPTTKQRKEEFGKLLKQ